MITLNIKPNSNLLKFLSSIFSPASFFLPRNRFLRCLSTLRKPCHEYSDEHLHHRLHKCVEAQTFEALQSFHGLTITLGCYARQPIYFSNNVISLCVHFDELQTARKVFDKMPQRNGVSYNALISAYSRDGEVDDAWMLFCGMWGCGFRPTQFTFGGLLSCPCLDIRRGCIMHGLMLKNGLFFCDPHGGTALLGMFARNGNIDEAVRVFEDMPQRSLITWNSIISVLGYHGFIEESMSLFCELMRSEYGISGSTVVGLLSGFVGRGALELGQQIHSLVVKKGLNYDVSTSNALLNMCVKCLDIFSAEKMFKEVPFRDIVTYNTLIGASAKGEKPGRGLELLLCLLTDGIVPNVTTYVGVINCCANLRIQMCGEYIHSKVIRNSLQSDVFVGTALVDFYGRCGMLHYARCCFDEIFDKNVVSWNSLIVAYTSINHTNALALFHEMLQLGYCPNEFTFSSVLKASSAFELQQLHCLTMRTGYFGVGYVFTSLMTSYARNGLLSDALFIATSLDTTISVVSSNVIAATYNRAGQYDKTLEILSTLDEPDIVSWNILVSTCSHKGHHIEAFELFKHMLEVHIYPDNYTIISVLSGCTSLRCLAFGSSVHGLLSKTSFHYCDTILCNILIDMYAKFGYVEDSVKIFQDIINKNLITWTIMISALGHHGCARQALERFKEMELLGIAPDSVSFVAVLSACRHGGLVREGMELFSQVQKKYQIEPNMDHYHGVVDLLARHGHLKEAEKVVSSMPFPPNVVIWRSFLEGCKRWRNNESLPRGYLNQQLH